MAVFTIAISGCSSSGKSTLAYLLSEIFSSIDVSEESTKSSFSTPTPHKVQVLHADAFFLPKPLCPTTRFHSMPADAEFCQKKDTIRQYAIIKDENDAKRFRITGPNTDCEGAVNYMRLSSKLSELCSLSQATLPHSSTPIAQPKPNTHDNNNAFGSFSRAENGKQETEAEDRDEIPDLGPPFPLLDTLPEDLAREHREIIQAQRCILLTFVNSYPGIVGSWPRIVVVEGFMLFSDTDELGGRCLGGVERGELRRRFRGALRDLACLNGDVGLGGGLREEKEMEVGRLNRVFKMELMTRFNIKLFLPISKKTAKKRRFERPGYRDSPEGNRIPGQMWKTEGYFEGVAWECYVGGHGWLLDAGGQYLGGICTDEGKGKVKGEYERKGGLVKGVHVRGLDLGLEETVEWAVGCVIAELREMVWLEGVAFQASGHGGEN